MHRVFQAFIDGLAASGDTERLRTVLADAGAALDLSCFAYLSMPSRRGDAPELISNYPVEWTDHYLREHYERVDPVIVEALTATEPFEWGQEFTVKRLSKPQCVLLDDAAQFGVRCGFTVRSSTAMRSSLSPARRPWAPNRHDGARPIDAASGGRRKAILIWRRRAGRRRLEIGHRHGSNLRALFSTSRGPQTMLS